MTKSHSLASAAFVIALLLSLGTIAVLAAGPGTNDPFHAPFIDNRLHTLPGHSDTWFKFDYSATDPTWHAVATLRLVNGARTGVRFQVWPPENINAWWEKQPVGVGTEVPTDCETGQVKGNGECQSGDLNWSGAFGATGTYYVRVLNDNDGPADYALVATGESIRLSPPPPFTPAAPTARPPIPSTPTFTPVAVSMAAVDDPGRAIDIDGQPRTIPGNAATWFKFEYGDGETRPRTVRMLRLVNGVVTSVRFEVWAQQNLDHWWEKKPVGRGTQEVLVNCFQTSEEPTPTTEPGEPTPTPVPTATPTGKCYTNDLTWAGAFGAPGTYYVRVVNDNSAPMYYVLTLQ